MWSRYLWDSGYEIDAEEKQKRRWSDTKVRVVLIDPPVYSLDFCGGIWGLYDRMSEKAMATHSSTLAWKIPWAEEPGRLQSMGLLRVRHDWVTSLSLFTFMHWGNGNPLHCSCLENPRGGGACWAAIYGVAQSRTWLKQLSSSSSIKYVTIKYSYYKDIIYITTYYKPWHFDNLNIWLQGTNMHWGLSFPLL